MDGFTSRTGSLVATFSAIDSIKTLKDSRCHAQRRSAAQIAAGDLCVLGQGRDVSFAVIGDSHAGAVFEALGAYHAPEAFAFYAISGPRCAPLANGFRLDRYASGDCVDTTRQAFARIASTDSVKDVVLVAEWPLYTTGLQKGFRNEGDGRSEAAALAQDDSGAAGSVAGNGTVFGRSLALTVAMLQRAHKRVLIVTSVPEFDTPVIPAISKGVFFNRSIVELASFAPSITVPEYLSRNVEVTAAFEKLTGVAFVPMQDVFCDRDSCRSVDPEGRILFSDASHVTEYGARRVAERIMKQIAVERQWQEES
jgi:hypothetical protein